MRRLARPACVALLPILFAGSIGVAVGAVGPLGCVPSSGSLPESTMEFQPQAVLGAVIAQTAIDVASWNSPGGSVDEATLGLLTDRSQPWLGDARAVWVIRHANAPLIPPGHAYEGKLAVACTLTFVDAASGEFLFLLQDTVPAE